MSKNKKVVQYLKESGIKHDSSPSYLYMMSKTLGFTVWDFCTAWKNLFK